MAKHEYYVVQGKTLDNVAETMKTVLGVDKDTPIRFDEITNNEKAEQVTENVDAQAEVIEQIKAALNGKSSIGVKEIMDIIDQSGVLGTTDGTATEKVEQLIDKAEDSNLWYEASKKMTRLDSKINPIFNQWQYSKLPKIDFSGITLLPYAMYNTQLEYIDFYINSGNCANFDDALSFNKKLKWIVGIDLSSATSIFDLFYNSTIETIYEPLNIAKVTNAKNAFLCDKLKDISFYPETIPISITIPSPVLSDESIQSIIDGLATVETAQTLTLHADVKAKLTEEQLATITNKNWNLA